MKIDKKNLLDVLAEMLYAVEGFACIAPGDASVPFCKWRSDGLPGFVGATMSPEVYTYTTADGDRWVLWAGTDEFALTGSKWGWEVRMVAPINYVALLETLNMSRVLLGHAFQHDEKAWLLVVTGTMVKRVLKARVAGGMIGKASISKDN